MLTPGIVKSFTSSVHRLLSIHRWRLSQGEKRNDAVHMAQPTLLKRQWTLYLQSVNFMMKFLARVRFWWLIVLKQHFWH